MKNIVKAGDTYHNRFSQDSPYLGNKKYKKFPKKCSKCGTTKGPFDLHHIDGDRNNTNRSNLRVLCRSCHRKLHDGGGEQVVSSAARIIDDPQNELSKAIAKNHKNSDLMYVEYILCHADVNANKDRFVSDDLSESAETAINKPINWEHKDKNIGVIYESRFIEIEKLSEKDKNYFASFDPLEKDFVVCRAAIWEYKHPIEARIMRERAEANKLYFSMENNFGKSSCSVCNEVFDSVFDYCDHLLTRNRGGNAERIFIDSNFIGAAIVRNPADDKAVTLALANKENKKEFLYNILNTKILENFSIADIISYIIK